MALSSLLSQIFLSFSNATIMVPILLGGLIWEVTKGKTKFPIWKTACLLVLFSMILNMFLKSLFLVPLNPVLGKEGFALPSGHMQVSVTLYGWLFWSYTHHRVRGFILLILAGIGYGLVYEGYHNVMDVVAAIIVAVGTVFATIYVYHIPWFLKNPACLGLCMIPLSIALMGGIWYRMGLSSYSIKTFLGLIVASLVILGLENQHA